MLVIAMVVLMGIGDPDSPSALLGMAPMDMDMGDWMGLPIGVPMLPMDVFGTVGGRLDLFMHFSMCPLRTSLRLNFLPQS